MKSSGHSTPQILPTVRIPLPSRSPLKGDACEATLHIVLGWLVDTVRLTIKVPPHRVERLLAILASIEPTQKRIQVVKWHQVMGELLGIPGAIGLFSVLQEAFRNQTDNRIRLSPSVHAFLDDFRWLVQDLSSRPTRLAEILPRAPRCHCSSPCCRQYHRTWCRFLPQRYQCNRPPCR
jgi:hypothetical protein